MSREITAGATQLWAIVSLVTSAGAKATGVLAGDVVVRYQAEGEAVSDPLELTGSADPAWAEGKWFEIGGGDFRVGLPLALAAADRVGSVLRVVGEYSGGDLHGETLSIVAEPPGAGTGPFLVTLVVTDDQDPPQPVQLAEVTALINGGATRRNGTTDTDGRLPLGLGAGAWTLLFDVEGHDAGPLDVTVEGSGEVEVTLPRTALPANDDPTVSIGVLRCFDPDIEIEPGAKVTLILRSGVSEDGRVLNTRPRSKCVDSEGNDLQFRCLPDATYYVLVGDETKPNPDVWFTAGPAGTTFLIREVLGHSR